MDLPVWSIVVPMVILFPLHVAAYADGKVEASCSDMVPRHPFPIQNTTAPYALTVTVTLKSISSDNPIEGFMIQARQPNSNTPLGSFQISGADVQTLTCTTTASAVSHTSKSVKSAVQVTWIAPSSKISNIQIRATVMRNGTVFWTNVVGPNLMYAGSRGSQILASMSIMCTSMLVSVLVST